MSIGKFQFEIFTTTECVALEEQHEQLCNKAIQKGVMNEQNKKRVMMEKGFMMSDYGGYTGYGIHPHPYIKKWLLDNMAHIRKIAKNENNIDL